MSLVDTTSLGLPQTFAGHHVLALPTGTDVLHLAGAWFPQSEWMRLPVAPVASVPRLRLPSGARFRGLSTETEPELGALRLTEDTELRGPTRLDPTGVSAATLAADAYDAYAVVRTTDFGDVLADDPQVLGWMLAASRRVAGLIAPAGGGQVIAPDAAGSVDLTLWSPVALTVDAAVPIVRPMLTGARVSVVPQEPQDSRAVPADPADPADAEQEPRPSFELLATYEYDGEVRVTCTRSTEVALVLSSLDWRTYGSFAYRVTWKSPVPDDELDSDRSSPLHLIARGRIAPHLARVVSALAGAVGGIVVDDGGFLVGADELDARQSAIQR